MILATRNHGDVQLRGYWPGARVPSYAEFLGVQGSSGYGPSAGVPAVGRAVQLAAGAVAVLRLQVWRGQGVQRQPVDNTWQARFFDGEPNEDDSWFLTWERTESSLTARNNAYWVKGRDPAGRVESVRCVHPDLVTDLFVNGRRRIWVSDEWGKRYELDPNDVLHFRGAGQAGYGPCPSPLQIYRDRHRIASSQIRHEAKFYERGMASSLAVSFPAEVTSEQAREWRQLMEELHGGAENAHRIKVTGGGATWSTVGISMRDAQYIESQQFTVEEIARIYNVLSSLLDSKQAGSNPLAPEHEQRRWLTYCLAPRLVRLESAVRHDPEFFGSRSSTYPQFQQDIVRGDVTAEAEYSTKKVQSGQWTPDEARARDGLPPLPNGIGAVPQFTPVGGAPNPNNPPTPAPEVAPSE